MTVIKTKQQTTHGSDGRAAVVLTNRNNAATAELVADHATFKASVDALETLAEELAADHATFKTVVDELKTDYTALLADITAHRTSYNALLAKLDADGGVTDTNYVATVPFAALTATAIAASSPATLSASAAIPSAPATLTATASADTIGNPAGTEYDDL